MEQWYLACLGAWVEHYGTLPSVPQLSDWLGKSGTAIRSALLALEAKGYTRRDPRGYFYPVHGGEA